VLLAFVSTAGPPANQLQAAIRALARAAEIVAAAEIFAGCEWPNAAEAEAAREALLDAVDRAAEAAADAGHDELYAAWSSFGSATAIDMAERAMQAPRLVEYRVQHPIGALVLAHRLYQDATRADELVALGDAPHPGFLPPTGPALAQ
jgi:prophage DNA circulation protein